MIAYLGALFILLLNAFWAKDAFTGQVEPFSWTLDAFSELVHERGLPDRSPSGPIGDGGRWSRSPTRSSRFPIAYYMARVASPRTRGILVVAVLMPLWAAYLVKVYAWRTILQGNGFLEWVLGPFGIAGPGLDELANTWLVFSYLWLPYMILPIYAGLERIPTLAAGGIVRPRRRGPARRSDGSSCRSSSRPSWPARSSRSR